MFKTIQRVEAIPQANNGPVMTKPGIDGFTVTGVSSKTTQKDDQMIQFQFTAKDGSSQFQSTFFLTEKALPRFCSLMLDLGVTEDELTSIGDRNDAIDEKVAVDVKTLSDEEKVVYRARVHTDIEQIALGKSVRLKVSGEIKVDTRNNNPDGYVVPTLAYAGFSESIHTPIEDTKLRFDPKRDIKDTRPASTAVVSGAAESGKSDLPF